MFSVGRLSLRVLFLTGIFPFLTSEGKKVRIITDRSIHTGKEDTMSEKLSFSVKKSKERALRRRMKRLKIYEKDLVENFIRSSGKGGQRTNKVATCVYLKHIPTGLEVKCQKERQQSINRFLARRLLADKIESMIMGKRSREQQKIEKLRRQKRKRSKRAKEKMLEIKRKQSEKKEMRRYKPEPEDFEK
jgi:protein subunit release factor B